MMKKLSALFLSVLIIIGATSCTGKTEVPSVEPKVSQMRAICELATMDCYFHNVAKFSQENADKFLWITKDKRFWIEYSGRVKLGINASLVTLEVQDTNVTITIPPAKVLGCEVDITGLSKESFIVDVNSAKITADDETHALAEAQAKMEQEAASDKALLANAQQQAQTLLENYVKNIGKAVGKEYTVTWKYIDEDNSVPEQLGSESDDNIDAPQNEQ